MTLAPIRGWLMLPVVLLGLLGGRAFAETGESKPHPVLYAENGDWRVYLDSTSLSCSLVLRFDAVYFLFNSVKIDGLTKYHVSFGNNYFNPENTYYKYEIKSGNSTLLSMDGRGFKAPAGIGYVMVGPFDAAVLGAFAKNDTLHVKTDGVGGGDYRLGAFRTGFVRFDDCQKDLRGGKLSSSPKMRQMN